MWKQEGVRSFYKGITPRVMRVAPGQAVTFTVYEYLKGVLEKGREMLPGGAYEEWWLLPVRWRALVDIHGMVTIA
jgi:solute carrier family 25 citrate transporter 1